MSAAAEHCVTATWAHDCPYTRTRIDEHDPQILECRCFEGPQFFAAQDQIAVNLDALRVPGEQ